MTGEEETATSAAAESSPAVPRPRQDPGAAEAEPDPEPAPAARKGRGRNRSFWREFPILIVVALTIALLIKTFVIQAFFIPSGSMQNTLEIGDKVLVNKLVYDVRPIRPGDIIVFDGAGSWTAPAPRPHSSNPVGEAYDVTLRPLLSNIAGLFGSAPGQTDFIKRVIGVPGDHVACCTAGRVTVNGVPLRESSYLFPGNAPGEAPLGESGRFSITVPKGRLWVMGDHRAISDDSRGHADDPGDGTIPESEVIGRAFVIVWPASRWRVLGIPATFAQHGIIGGAISSPPFLPLSAGIIVAVPAAALWRRRRVRVRRQ